MSKSHSNEGFKQRFKQFLGIKKGSPISISIHDGPKTDEFTFTNELLQEMGQETPVASRVKILKDLCEFLVNRKLEDHATEAAWHAVEDLLHHNQPQEARHVTLQFLSVLVSCQFDRLHILRAHFFKIVVQHKIPEDFIPRIQLLKALSDNGKDITYFEEDIGTFLLSWMPEVIHTERLEPFMSLLINVIHYNSSYLDENVVAGIVRENCNMARTLKNEKNVELSLCLLDAVVRYSSLPVGSVHEFISALCSTVNLENCCQHSWKIMRNVLGTHLGHRGVYTMCSIMESGGQQSSNVMQIRGAVFFIGMCLWGSQRVTTLKHSHSTVLPSMLQSLFCHHPIVSLEVTLSIQRLVKKYGHELHVVSWDSVLDITSKLQAMAQAQQQKNSTLVENLHTLLNYIEELVESGKYRGSEERFYDIVEKSSSKRPESSLHLLVSFRAQTVHPAHAGWLNNLQNLMEKYFRYEIRTSVRVKTLEVLSFVLTSYRHWYEEELLDLVVLPFLNNITDDQDVTVRTSAVQLLLDLSQTCDSSKCADILDIVEKVISRRVEVPGKVSPTESSQEEEPLKDIKTAITGLVQVFKVKLFRLPHSHAQKVFSLLVTHLRAHYYYGYNTNTASVIRNIIFECFLSLRCDTSHRLGFVDGKAGDQDKVSLYFVCTSSALTSSGQSKPSYSSPLGVIPYSDAFNVIISCLKYEWTWRVLEHVLSELPNVLQNKTLVLAADPSLNVMSSVLCKMVTDPATVLDLQQVPQGVGRTGFQALIFPVLTVLATYHFRLDRTHQCELVQSLELGFVSKCANLCVSSLMLCTMEMQAVMNSLLPAIMVRLSQISATISMAVPMLEFLSGLVHLPHLYASFKENQYKSVFAICLPYTDPFRYSQYTVTLAYHVITAWFVRARVAYRKDFVGYITKALKTNIRPERHEQRADSPAVARSRSGSAIQQQPSPQPSTRSASPSSAMQAKETESAYEFHKEMSEVCMDMMARYSFAMSLSQPKRTTAMEFLLSKGKTRQWIVGNAVVSITTSGTYIELDGVCENCLPLHKRHQQHSSTALSSNTSLLSKRRKSKEKILEEYSLSAKVETTTVHDEKGAEGRSSVSQDGTLKPDHQKQSGRKSPVGEGGRVDGTSERPKNVEHGDAVGYGSTEDGLKTQGYRKWAIGIQWMKILSKGGTSVEMADCHCICQGWAEIVIRRPSGNISWTMRIQNRLVGPLLTMPEVDGDVTTALVDDPHIKEYLLLPDGETDQLKIRTKSREVLSTSTDSDVLLIELVKKERPKDTQDTSERVVVKEDTEDKGVCQASPDSQQEEEDDYMNPNSVLSLQGFTPSSPLLASPYDSSGSEMGSLNRPRLLSNSPRRGPSAFRMTRYSESSDQFEHKSLPRDMPSTKRQLSYEKPELGVSPAELDSTLRHLSQPDHHPRDHNMYLSSSEMYRLASDDGEGDKSESKHDGKTSEPKEPELGRSRQQPVKLRLKEEARAKSQRPKSLPLEFHTSEPISESSHTTQHTSHAKRDKEENRLKEESKGSHSASASPRTPVKAKLKKSISLSSPRRIRKNANHLGESKSSHMLQNTTTDDMGYFSKAHKSSSSPELSSPTQYRASMLQEFGKKKKTTTQGTKQHDTIGTSSKEGPEVSSIRDPPKLVPTVESYRYPLDPNFVFLQLYQTAFSGCWTDKPIPLPEGEVIDRAIKCLDRIPPYDTHKIGVIYVGPGQHNNETSILRNVYGSARYMKFLSGLGSLIRLRDCPPAEIYMGGLDREGGDGEFAYSWQDNICQVIFHVATLMPTKDSDPGCNSKKMHIGNDFVTIVYNDSEENVAFGTIKGQFNFAELVITPLDNECNVIRMRFKETLKNLYVDTGARVISDSNLPMLVRQLAIHINMASVLHQGQKRTTDAYGCNWLERLRQIKRLRNKAVTESVPPCTPPPTLTKSPPGSGAFGVVVPSTINHPHLMDFTEYVANEKK